MIINAYDTLPGKVYKVTEKTEGIIKTLALTDQLISEDEIGVFYVDHSVVNIPPFSFPISLKSHTDEWITVYDKRPFLNKANKVTNQPEADMFKVAACLQQAESTKNSSILKTARHLTVKGFVGALSSLLSRRGGLSIEETMHLEIILTHYWVCMTESSNVNREFITVNVCKDVLHIRTADNYIQEIPEMDGIKSLLDVLHDYPQMYKLKAMDLKDFLSILSKLSFSSVGRQVITSAVEAPCLMTAIIYSTINNNLYSKTPIGIALDPKRNKQRVEELTRTFHYSFKL